MRSRNVTFVGNCQALAMCTLYREFVGGPNGETVSYFNDHDQPAEVVLAGVADADQVIVQDRDFKHGLTADDLKPGTDLRTFPMVLAGFIWPFANEPHVHNAPQPPFSDGPYPSQLSDGFLNRLIRKGVPPEEALEQYLALDIARATHIDRMAELYLEKQLERDSRTGFSVTPVIEAEYRRQHLFRTPHHPNAMLFGVVARQLFANLGVPSPLIGVAVESLQKSPFPTDELPIHPGVIRHFGLEFADDETRYSYFDEGAFTFAEFVLRYMRYESNHALRTSIAMIDAEDPARNLALLEEGLAASPRSVRGWRFKGRLLDRLGRRDEAADAYARSIALDPADADSFVALAQSLLERDRVAEAEAAARAAVAAAPAYATGRQILAEVLLRARKGDEAAEAAREAARPVPGRPHLHQLLGLALMMAGRPAEAKDAAREAMRMEPTSADHRNLMAEVHETLGERADAIRLLLGGPRNTQSYSLLGNFHWRDNDLALAEEAFATGATMDAGRPDLAECLATIQARRQREEA